MCYIQHILCSRVTLPKFSTCLVEHGPAMEEVVARDTPTLVEHFLDVSGKLRGVEEHVNTLQQHVRSSEVKSTVGLLELKNLLLLRLMGNV